MKYFDLHCDTLCKCVDKEASLDKNNFHIDIDRLSRFDKVTQVFACFIDDKYSGEFATIRFYALLDVYNNTDFRNVTPMLSIENLSCLNGDLEYPDLASLKCALNLVFTSCSVNPIYLKSFSMSVQQ